MKTLKWMTFIVVAVVGGSWLMSKLSTPKQGTGPDGNVVINDSGNTTEEQYDWGATVQQSINKTLESIFKKGAGQI